MKKIFLIAVLSLAGCSAEPLSTNECDCIREYYRYRIVGYANNGLTPVRAFVFQNANPSIKMPCDSHTNGGYILIEGDMYEKIICE